MSVLVFAEGEGTPILQTTSAVETVPPTVDAPTEGVIPGTESTPEADTEGIDFSAEKIVAYVKAHLEEISVIITLIITCFWNKIKYGRMDKSVATLNNNAVNVAKDSREAIDTALSGVTDISAVVGAYKDEIAKLLSEVRKNAEEKQAMEKTLAEVSAYLKNAKLANIEFANEMAELLILANIPNAKKEELYARHLAAVNSIAEAENTEVVEDVTADTAEAA
jgi:hypothetical protein